MIRRVLLVIAGLAMVPAMASAQWSDNFDSYAAGSINGLGGWQGWDNVPAGAGVVTTTMARSGPHSQGINGAADSVRRYTGVNTGQWTYSAWQFIPQGFSGDTFFILNNVYNDGGPYNWAVQLKFSGSAGTVIDDNGRAGNAVNFVRGQWAEIRVDFDLNANTLSQYYNNSLIASGTWASAGAIELGAVDLFANNASIVFYDDMSLSRIPAPSAMALFGLGGLVAMRRRR